MTAETGHDAVLLATVPPGVAGLRRSPLAHRAADLEAGSGASVRLRELPFSTQLSLRVVPGSAAAERVGEVLGVPLPAPGRSSAGAAASVLWLGPDDFLVVAADGAAPGLLADLAGALAGDRGAVTDVSANRTTLVVEGPAAVDVLAKGCSIDLHPRVFGAGHVAVTTLARSNVVLWRPGDDARYRLGVRPSFASYLADWLLDAAWEFTG